MIRFTRGNIFDSRCQALVNPVNCVGVMGKGLALQFKRRFPSAFMSYPDACRRRELAPGHMHIFHTSADSPRFIVNFPTKRHWRDPSRLDDIANGLSALDIAIAPHRIGSIAILPLGCGLGGLAWRDVRELIASRLSGSRDVRILIYTP